MIERLADFLRRNGNDLNTFGVVFDIGSRDALQAVELSRLFPMARVVAVECNPATLTVCRANIAGRPQITLVEKAINSHTGRCAFYPTDPLRTVTSWPDGNPGASSLFLATGDYPPETYVQRQIEVDCTRLDDLCGQLGIDVIDLIWIDLQGAELVAFQSAGALLDKVRYIFTEVSFRPIYKEQCLFDEVDAFLTARGFRRCSQIDRSRWQQDVIYENSREFVDVLIPAGSAHADIIELSVRSVQNCVRNFRQLYVTGEKDPGIENVRFFDQQNFPFDAGCIRGILGPDRDPAEYLQQLTKLHFPILNRACLPDLLVVDPGTVFLEPCRFVQEGRPVFNFGDDYDPQHFEHMTRLLPSLHRMFAYSGISHCMLFRRPWLQALHNAVGARNSELPFWKAWLHALICPADQNGASEAEVYFNFCLMSYAGKLILRRFRWSRVSRIGEVPPDSFDYVSLPQEDRKKPGAARYWKPLLSSNRAALDPKNAGAWTAYAGRLFDARRFAEFQTRVITR